MCRRTDVTHQLSPFSLLGSCSATGNALCKSARTLPQNIATYLFSRANICFYGRVCGVVHCRSLISTSFLQFTFGLAQVAQRQRSNSKKRIFELLHCDRLSSSHISAHFFTFYNSILLVTQSLRRMPLPSRNRSIPHISSRSLPATCEATSLRDRS